MASNERARLILRVSRQEKDGGIVTEERETECAPQDLARHLGESWEVARHGDPPERALQNLEDHLFQSLLLLECVVTEGRDEEGRRTWALGFRKGEASQPEAGEPPTGSGTLRSGRRSTVHLRTDDGGQRVRMGGGRNALDVVQNSFCGVNWGNAYAIFDLGMELHLHVDAED
jgi:hypothetical protein